MVKIFGAELPDECTKAISELKRLKVYKIMSNDYIDSFADVWFRVQHECDMYIEEDIREMNAQAYKGAKRWLEKYKHLYRKYEDK